MEELCVALWQPLATPLTSLAILSRASPSTLTDRLLDWSLMRSDDYAPRRKFGTFGRDRDPLTFAEMKRTAVQCICLTALAGCLNVFGKVENEERMIMRLASYAGDVISEVHASSLRRAAYVVPLKELFAQISKSCFQVFLEYVNMTIAETSKSSRFELYIRSFSTVPLAIYPSEELEHMLCFVETLASYYADVKGFENREAFAEALGTMLLPLIELVSAEVNVPKWEKVFAKILLKRVFMLCEKQKYRLVTLDLAVIVLCLCSKDIFYERWLGLSEAIATMIKEGSLTASHSLSILQLIWVYCNRYPEAFATQSNNIGKIIEIFAPSNSKRTVASGEGLLYLFIGLAAILGPAQPQSFLRDTLLPLFEGLDGNNLENFPVGRVTVGVKTLLFFGSLQPGKSVLPTRDLLQKTRKENIQSLCTAYSTFKPDFITKEALERVRFAVGKGFLVLDNLLWDNNLYDIKSTRSHMESPGQLCLKLIIETSPSINPLFHSENQILELLLKYSAHTDESIASKSMLAFDKLLSNIASDNEIILRMYWLFAALFDKIPDRCALALETVSRLFPKMTKSVLCYVEGSGILQKDALPIIADMSVKSLVLLISSNGSARERGNEVLLQIEDHVSREQGSHEITTELSALALASRTHFQEEYLVSFEVVSRFLNDVLKLCPTIAGLSKSTLMARLQDIQSLLSGKSQYVEDELVFQWSYYLAALFCFGAPETNTNTLNKRIDGISLRRLLSFSKAESKLNSVKGFLQFALQNITNDNDLVCESLCDASFALNPLFLGEFFQVLEPCISAVSEDYRNVRYQVVRKNKRQDTLKIDLTRLLSRVVPKLALSPNGCDPQAPFHQIIKRYIIELFYFVSEIDTQQHLPGLRYGLAELVRNYHTVVHSLHPRYEFFPFKLQTELFQAFRGWFEDRRLGTMALATGATESSMAAFEPAPSMHSSSVLTLQIATQDVERMYAECLSSLCHGLLSPLPIYRNESIPSSQVLRWVDSLILCEVWGPFLVRAAVRNILTSNRAVLEKIVQKIFQADVVLQYPALSDSYFLAVCEALLDGKVDLPTHSIVALLTFKNIQGSSEVKKMAEHVAQIWLKTEFDDPSGITGLIDSLPSSLCMLSSQVISELVLRVEYLLSGPLERSVKNLLCSWLQKVAFIPGQHSMNTLQSIALLTLRYHQRDSLADSFALWDSLLLWKHHFAIIVELWTDLILRYRNIQLLEVSGAIIKHLCQKKEHLPVIFDAIIALIEPKKCLLVEQKFSNIILTSGRHEDGDFFASSRMDTILQTSEKSSIPSDFTVGHIVGRWIFELYASGMSSIMEYAETQHLWMLLKRNEYPPIMEHVNSVSIDQLAPLGDDMVAFVALQWAIRCPIKIHALCSWEILSWRMAKLSTDEVRRLVPIIVAYIRLMCTIPLRTKCDSPRVRVSFLVSQALVCLRSVSSMALEATDIKETLCSIALAMLNTDELIIFSESLCILSRTITATGLLDTGLIFKILRGYTDVNTGLIVCEFSCSLMNLLFKHVPDPNIAAQLLICLLPAMLDPPNKMVTEAVSMACNILEGHDRARLSIRVLQSFGKKKYRNSSDAARGLSLIFSDDLFMNYSALTIQAIDAVIKSANRERMEMACHFLTHWMKNGKFTEKTSSLWEPLAEALVETSQYGHCQSVIAAIDAISAVSKTGLQPEHVRDPIKPLGTNTDLSGINVPVLSPPGIEKNARIGPTRS